MQHKTLVMAMATAMVLSSLATISPALAATGKNNKDFYFFGDTAVHSGAASKALEAKFAKADSQAEVYIDETFTQVADGQLSAGWRLQPGMSGTAKVVGGNLLIDGTSHASNMNGVMLPASLESLSNYRIDMDFTIDSVLNDMRWVSVMYRTQPLNAKNNFEPYYQFAVRQKATDASGTEFAFRTAASGWDVQSKKPFTENISKDKRYTATVIVHGNRVRQYINGVLQHDTTMGSAANVMGGVGLQTAGTVMRVYSVKVTKQVTALPELELPVAVQETGTTASMAPTLVQGMNSIAATEGDGSSNSFYVLDSALNLSNASGKNIGSLLEYFQQTRRVTVPVMRVKDQATIDALKAFSLDGPSLADMTLISDDVALLKDARVKLPQVRTAVDFSAAALSPGKDAILKITGDTNRAGAKIAVLPANLVTRDVVSHLQRLLITVWAPSNAKTAEDAAKVLVTGVNGVVASDSKLFAEVMRKLPANTLLRKPLVTGHRGMPANGEHDENTLESAKAAVDAGADAVENDIYITTDGHLVIMHDDTVNRTTTGTGKIETMSLEQVKALRTKTQGLQVPTMREYFKAFKDKPITHFIEIKSGTPSVVAQLKKEMEEEGVADQSVAISFSSSQLKLSVDQMPELTLGFLGGSGDGDNIRDNVRKVLEATQQNYSTFNPGYTGLKRETMEAAKHRGTTFWPWTLNNEKDFYKFYSWGTHGLTTDFAKWASNFPVEIAPGQLPAKVALNEAVSLPVQLTTQTRNQLTANANEVVLLGGTAAAEAPVNGKLKFTSAGTAVVMPGYRYVMGDGTYSYVILSKPVTLIVGDGTGGVVGTPTSSASGDVSCTSAVPGQSSACTVTPKPGYELVGVASGSNCPAGSWNADKTVYNTGVIAANCEVKFDFAAKPAQASLAPVGKTGVVNATVSGGGSGLWAFDGAVSVAPAANAESAPKGVNFPMGLVSLRLNGGEPGQSAAVVLTYPEDLPKDGKYYKYGKTKANPQPHWYEFAGAVISGNKVTLTLTDGGDGDDDLQVNGSITDPGGVGVTQAGPVVTPPAGNVASVPSLGTGAVIGLSWALGALAWLRSRRRERASSLTS